MPMPDLEHRNYDLWLFANEVTPADAGSATFLGSYGLSIDDPYQLTVRAEDVRQPLSHGDKPIADGYLDGFPIMMETLFWDTNPFSLISSTIAPLQTKLIQMTGPSYKNKYQFLLLWLWNGSSLVAVRRYVHFRVMKTEYIRKTLLCAMRATFTFRVVDPLLYGAGTVELTASGTSPVAVNVASGELIGHKRIYYKITRVSGTITNPVITNTTTGETFSITGSLTAANEFYYVDPYAGRLKKGTGTIEAATDEIGNMSGRFIPREAAAMALSLSFTGGGTATFDVHHLNTMYS